MTVRVTDDRDDNTSNSDRDKLIKDYDTILKEAALLTTFTGILFGFLLNISVTSSQIHYFWIYSYGCHSMLGDCPGIFSL